MLGDKIRKIRKNEGLTAAALAERTGVSESCISQLERGLMDPSVSLLRRLASSLGVNLASFFDDDGSEPIITRLEDRASESTEEGVRFSWISPEAEGLRLEMAQISMEPGSAMQAPGKEHYVCLFLIEGSLLVRYGETDAALQPGDTIFIPSDTAFSLTALAQGAVGILCVSKGGQAI